MVAYRPGDRRRRAWRAGVVRPCRPWHRCI